MTSITEAAEALTASINKDLSFYTSDFCRKEMEDIDRKDILHRIQGKKEALELITGKQYSLSAEGLIEDSPQHSAQDN